MKKQIKLCENCKYYKGEIIPSYIEASTYFYWCKVGNTIGCENCEEYAEKINNYQNNNGTRVCKSTTLYTTATKEPPKLKNKRDMIFNDLLEFIKTNNIHLYPYQLQLIEEILGSKDVYLYSGLKPQIIYRKDDKMKDKTLKTYNKKDELKENIIPPPPEMKGLVEFKRGKFMEVKNNK